MIKTLISAVCIILFMPLLDGIQASKKNSVDQKPKIISQEPLKPAQCEQRKLDPLGCNGANVIIENLNFRQIVTTLNCGPESEEIDVAVPARTRLYVEIELDFSGTCRIKSWK